MPRTLRPLHVLVLLAALVACASSPSFLAPNGYEEGYLEAPDGVSLFYRVVGSGGDTLVALHGGPGLPNYLHPDLEPLASTHALIFYDQRGAGRSTAVAEPRRLHAEALIDDLELLREHFGMERMNVLGHSWGAGLGTLYALRHPDRVERLVLVGPVPARQSPYMQEFGANLTGWMDEVTSATVNELIARFDADEGIEETCRAFWSVYIRGYFPDPHDPSGPARMRGDVCDAPPAGLRNTFYVNAVTLGSLGAWDWREDLRTLHVPTLVIHGAGDPIPVASAHEWAEALPAAELMIIEGAGHFPYLDDPEAFFRGVREFLRRG